MRAHLHMCACACACLPPCILSLGPRLRQAHVHSLILAVEVIELRAVGQWRPACGRERRGHRCLIYHGALRGTVVVLLKHHAQCYPYGTPPRHVSIPRRPFQRAGVADELPARVGPFASRQRGTTHGRTEAYMLKTVLVGIANGRPVRTAADWCRG